MDWNALLIWTASRWKPKKPKDIIPRMSLGIIVYAIWKERNARIFKFEGKAREVILKDSFLTLQYQIQIKWRKDPKLQDYLDQWATWT